MRCLRRLKTILCVVLLAGVPVHASPVRIGDVIQTIGSIQNSLDLKLRNVSQDPMSSDDRDSARSGKSSDPATGGSQSTVKTDSLIPGQPIGSDSQRIGVDVIDQGDVEGSVCDCGEILVPGGFPKWPLLFLAAIPLFFIHNNDCDDCNTPSPTPTPIASPTPTPPPPPGVPEPTSLLLLGTGLAAVGAGLRRRYAKGKQAANSPATGEE
jgi:PEP-CTERM motif